VQKIGGMAFPSSRWQIDRMDRTRDCGARCGVRLPHPPPSLAPFRGEERKLAAVPGRSFGCGGAIKNSPLSGAWTADGGHVASSTIDSVVSLFMPRVRLYRYLYQQLCRSSALSLRVTRNARPASAMGPSRGLFQVIAGDSDSSSILFPLSLSFSDIWLVPDLPQSGDTCSTFFVAVACPLSSSSFVSNTGHKIQELLSWMTLLSLRDRFSRFPNVLRNNIPYSSPMIAISVYAIPGQRGINKFPQGRDTINVGLNRENRGKQPCIGRTSG